MGERTGIAWCDHTFNPWWGCTKVSPACKNCYAETMDARLGGGHWGDRAPRRFFGAAHWRAPFRWNAAAERAGVRRRVFCASMADVFEDRPELEGHRNELWEVINETENLDWLLLTKRPENIERMLPAPLITREMAAQHGGNPQPFFENVWLGTTVESQEYAIERIPHLLANPAVVHFISAEPLLGELDLEPWLHVDGISWVITGSESGRGKRPQNIDWFRSLRDQCAAYGTPFFLKQAEPAVDRENGLPLISIGHGSRTKARGELIDEPYLDGEQHVAIPVPRTFRRENFEVS